jgi:integrating conjugative element membrane protein (TIGR03747 family)
MINKTTKELTMFGHCFWFVYKFILCIFVWGLFSWVVTLLVMCCVAFFVSDQTSIGYVKHLLIGQLNYLSCFGYKAKKVRFAVNFSHTVFQWLFIKSHIVNYLQHLKQNCALNEIRNYFCILEEVTMLFSVKLVIVFLSIPLFLLFGFVGLVDGLVQRDLRKFGGGRESSLMYHSAKRLVFPILILGYVVYLMMPFNFLPAFIFLLFAALFGFFVATTIKTFKKYV